MILICYFYLIGDQLLFFMLRYNLANRKTLQSYKLNHFIKTYDQFEHY